uniref:Uncharacterized protein n=1 Tax=Siphoviridae sp. ctiV651 TaxID=2827917 RepID=A0A8S5S4S5_9CAUD|nr:MAG TPA: hypothetical protein [Siphoviridae sp. ctiV651]
MCSESLNDFELLFITACKRDSSRSCRSVPLTGIKIVKESPLCYLT